LFTFKEKHNINIDVPLFTRRPLLYTQVSACCELLGLDPFSIANEGKLIAIVPESSVAQALSVMHKHPLAAQAAVIGEVVSDKTPMVYVKTPIGGKRLLHMAVGDQMPRIC